MALFPLALILGIGLFRGDKQMIAYAFPLSLFGLAVGLIQAIDIHFPSLRVCSKECGKATFSIFGLITFPDLSVIGFGLIAILLFKYSRRSRKG
jgi:disulfide bond formation protein DsbB